MTIRKDLAERIVAHCRKGYTANDAAALFEVSVPTVYKLCEAAGIQFKNKRTNDRIELARWVKQNKATAKQAMSVFRVSLPTLIKACRENGVELKREKAPPAIGAMKILAALMSGDRSSAEIASAFGVSRQRVEEVRTQAIQSRILGPRSLFRIEKK